MSLPDSNTPSRAGGMLHVDESVVAERRRHARRRATSRDPARPASLFRLPRIAQAPVARTPPGGRQVHVQSGDRGMRLSIQEVTTQAGLDALRADWEALSAIAESASPFNSWLWLATWWQVFGGTYTLRVFVVRAGMRIIGIAPFYVLSFGIGPLRLRVLVPLGYGNDLTERLEILVARGRRADVIVQLGAHLARRRKRLWDVLIWDGVWRDELPAALQRMVRRTTTRSYEVRALPGSWDEFVKALNKSMRDNIKYYPRLLERTGHRVHTHVAAGPEEMAPALEEFLRLHRARAALTDTHRHVDRFALARHRRFLACVAPVLAAAGAMRITILSVDGVKCAAQIALQCGETVAVYYSGFDPGWRRYSVGMIATAQTLRDALERGARQVDFLGGAGQFKERWDTVPSKQGRVILLRDAPHLAVAFAAYRLLQYVVIDLLSLRAHRGLSPRDRLMRWLDVALGHSRA